MIDYLLALPFVLIGAGSLVVWARDFRRAWRDGRRLDSEISRAVSRSRE